MRTDFSENPPNDESLTKGKTAVKLPWPPSVNAWWNWSKRRGLYVSPAGRAFKALAVAAIQSQRAALPIGVHTGRLAVRLEIYEPDKRKRDIDNLAKAPLDAVTASAAIWLDDSQIDALVIVRAGRVGRADACVWLEVVEVPATRWQQLIKKVRGLFDFIG
jgi:crossover junction endodeoxyribonuclease RusA